MASVFLSCPECRGGRQYTPFGLRTHLINVHRRDICPTCGADRAHWLTEMREEHYCPYPDGEGCIETK